MSARWFDKSHIQRAILKHAPTDVRIILLDDHKDAKTTVVGGRTYLRAHAPTPWVQDYLPEVVIDRFGQPNLVTFNYASKADYEKDQRIQIGKLLTGAGGPSERLPISEITAEQLAAHLGWPIRRSKLIMQGGHYIPAENGVIFISEGVLHENPDKSKLEINDELKRVLGARQVVWLPKLFGEETGHLDIYAMYLGNNKVLLQKHRQSHNTDVERAAEILSGLGYEIEYIHSPSAGQLYINSQRIGDLLLMPVYEPRSWWGAQRMNADDYQAKATFERLGFKVIPISSAGLEDRLGAIHCLTKTYCETGTAK